MSLHVSVDLANFSLQEKTAHNLMVAISRAWYKLFYAMNNDESV